MNEKLIHNPDILSCLANLSSDEVFAPPNIVNKMLDLLPEAIWEQKNIKILDPMCKSGVFLRECAKRFMVGLRFTIEDEDERLSHILKNQLFGLAITELTALISRRTLYCSKDASGVNSITSAFENSDGNISYKKVSHEWKLGQCMHCGARRDVYDREDTNETYAYNFIHPGEIQFLKEKFDVILGAPPYQLYDGGGTGSSAKPVYHHFINKALSYKPRYILTIIPARWYSGGKGLDDFRFKMLTNNNISKLVDYVDTRDCFPNVDIAGGICYFLIDEQYEGNCEVTTINGVEQITSKRSLNEFDTFIRNPISVEIVRKIKNKTKRNWESIVSSRMPFGLGSNVHGTKDGDLVLRSSRGKENYWRKNVAQGLEYIDKWKIYLSKASHDHGGQAGGDGKRKIFARIEVGEPGSICTESYLIAGVYDNKADAETAIKYLKTKFVRYMVSTTLLTHNISKSKFTHVPVIDLKQEITDEYLYKLFELNANEVKHIEQNIREI